MRSVTNFLCWLIAGACMVGALVSAAQRSTPGVVIGAGGAVVFGVPLAVGLWLRRQEGAGKIPTARSALAAPDSSGVPILVIGAAEQQTSARAIYALILGVLGVTFCACLAGIPALIVGVGALREVEASRGALSGRGMAIAAIVLGALSLVASAAFLSAYLINRPR